MTSHKVSIFMPIKKNKQIFHNDPFVIAVPWVVGVEQRSHINENSSIETSQVMMSHDVGYLYLSSSKLAKNDSNLSISKRFPRV